MKDNNSEKRVITHAFVTGATGLLGNNLVKALTKKGIKVTALVRSMEKAKKQFPNSDINFIKGDLYNPESYKDALKGCDALFHTAAYFREMYNGGGDHWSELYDTNVTGTINLMKAAKDAGIKNVIHTSSIAVLKGERNEIIDETMSRDKDDKSNNGYYRSKILSEEAVRDFFSNYPDIFYCFVLPGFMFGPGDIGSTSAGQLVMDFVNKKIPGIIPASFSAVDARDVSEHLIAAMEKGRKGERYLAAGQHITMKDMMTELSKATGVEPPKKNIPLFILKILSNINEAVSKITKKDALISKARVRLIENEYMRTNFSHSKSESELGCKFRPLEETLKDTVDWYKENGYL